MKTENQKPQLGHTKGPWTIGKNGFEVVSKHHDGLHIKGSYDTDSKKYYGGHLICESVAKCNIPVISAAPELLQVAKEFRHFLTIDLHDKKLNEMRDGLLEKMPELKSILQKTNDAITKATYNG